MKTDHCFCFTILVYLIVENLTVWFCFPLIYLVCDFYVLLLANIISFLKKEFIFSNIHVKSISKIHLGSLRSKSVLFLKSMQPNFI